MIDANPPLPCEVLHVHDGDTATVRAYLLAGPYRISAEIAVRFTGYDAPEIATNPHGKKDPVAGPAARDELARFLGSGQLYVRFTGELSFARALGAGAVVGPDLVERPVADHMRAAGFDVSPPAHHA